MYLLPSGHSQKRRLHKDAMRRPLELSLLRKKCVQVFVCMLTQRQLLRTLSSDHNTDSIRLKICPKLQGVAPTAVLKARPSVSTWDSELTERAKHHRGLLITAEEASQGDEYRANQCGRTGSHAKSAPGCSANHTACQIRQAC